MQILWACNSLVIKPPYGNIDPLERTSIMCCRIRYPKQKCCLVMIQ
ncbi:unnamed protein product, partial [Musa textilis]